MDTILPLLATRLANEGVPVAAIARSMATPSDEVMDWLHDAKALGRIVEIPRYDWPPGQLSGARAPTVAHQDKEAFIINLARVFHVTKLQATLLAVLVKRTEATKTQLHAAVEANRSDPDDEETTPKIVDVVIHHLRKRLKPQGLVIETVWGCGYSMSAEMRKRVLDKLAEVNGV